MQDISINHMPVGIFKINLKKQIIYVNQYFCNISGYCESQLLGKQWLDEVHLDDQATISLPLEKIMKKGRSHKFECRFINQEKEEIWVLCHLAPEYVEKNITNYVGIVTEINELKKTQSALEKLASYDPLTQLPNRYLFEELLIKSLSRAKRHSSTLALFYIDLDFFKKVNDFFGHGIGDDFLKEVGNRLRQSVRVEDFIVRLGGDEFAIILEDIQNFNTISMAAQRLIDDFNKSFNIGGKEIISSLSIGISVFPDEGKNAVTIVQHADQALYQAKQSGRNCYKYYNKTMQHQLDRYMLVVEHLRNAVLENQFELYYQPKIDVERNVLVGMEALLRWNNPIIGNASPAEFITIAEETGLMNMIGDWVIKSALEQYEKWFISSNNMKDITISVNLSPSQLNNSSLIETVTNVLRETKIPTQNILFELTETTVMKKALDSKSVLQVFLMELGIRISIDDFGTGYSSLTYLKQLPIRELKIDKSFIDDIGINKNSEVIIKAIINLGLTLDLDVVAEGVETKEQMDFLLANQCKIIQGYYLSKPLNVSQMTTYINSLAN
ncbi:MAG: GGDEF domain-containing protein [Tatlockia sp.]|nr:GGDEF domain-containing protein [Tatlockia sp.]